MNRLPLTILAELLFGLSLGGIVFFTTIIAPTAFKALSKKNANEFLQAIFPRYYFFFIALSGFAGSILSFTDKTAASVMLVIMGGFFISRQFLLPRINEARKAVDKGGEGAASKFSMLHRLAVGLNLLFMLGTFMIFLRVASS